MVWALGIEVINRQLKAKLQEQDGVVELRNMEILAQSGIPTPEHKKRKLIRDIDFTDWQLTSEAEYLQAYVISLPPSEKSLHQVFEFKTGETRFVVPALVLMRAVFRPERHLLPMMFGIQGLDNAAFLDHSTSPPKPVIHARWGDPSHRCSGTYIKEGLSWLTSFPSANRMASSVHQHALTGVIGLKLPIGRISGAVYGRKIDNTYYVCDINISSISTTEKPFDFASEHPSKIYMMPPEKTFIPPCTLPIYRDEDVILSDEEWDAVRPILVNPKSQAYSHLDQKIIFEEILRKIHTGTAWKKMVSQIGKWSTLQRAYERWKKSGRLTAAIRLLTNLREYGPEKKQSTLTIFQ